jgi:glycine dehydrogenase
LANAGFKVTDTPFFDTFTVDASSKGMTAAQIQEGAVSVGANVRIVDETHSLASPWARVLLATILASS